jgi:hypothetical protein
MTESGFPQGWRMANEAADDTLLGPSVLDRGLLKMPKAPT